MNKRQQERYRKLLLAKRAELLDRVREARSSEQEGVDKEAPDLGDRALSTVIRDLSYQLTAGERDMLRRIDEALDRMDESRYGNCIECGKNIQVGRLDAVPWARHCIECHSQNSKMESPPEGLVLSSLESVLAGGDRVALIPGRPEASEIVRRIRGLASPRMPFDGPPWLDEREESLIVDWIAGGALDDSGNPAPMPAGGRVRFRGVMSAPDAIDGAAFAVTGETRIDDLPPVGGQAEMRGRVEADGSIVAERLRDR